MTQYKPFVHKYFCATLLLTFLLSFTGIQISSGYTVTNLTATYKNGQVFLTWKNPSAKNLQYNVYRSTSVLSGSGQLTSSRYLGFVRDSSSKNIRLSQEYKQKLFYRISSTTAPLTGDKGLYVVTCTDSKFYYYAVTVTDLSTGNESKTVMMGSNSLSVGINEKVAKPLPVWQDSVHWTTGDWVQRYVQFVNNQETSLYPAMNSTGSYGFNFYLIKRGKATQCPLYVFYEGLQENSIAGNGLDEFANGAITNCYIMGVDDWLPVPTGKGGGMGVNTYFCCYHENFNIYSASNDIPTAGTVKTYPQKRYIESIEWAKSHFSIDKTEVYLVGVSAGGFGALLTASIIPDEIAAVYSVVEPSFIKPTGTGADQPEQMWGTTAANLNSDIVNPATQSILPIYTLMDDRKMVHLNRNLDQPLIFDIHGRDDKTVAWSPYIISWYDSVESNNVGGVFYWDNRSHDGTGANFSDTEITPDFLRYRTTKSYPAFSNCSINQDPGNGVSPNSGDAFGAINGYLDWEDDMEDNACDYTIHVFLKDLYVGGVPDPDQYTTCKTDITFRRLQNFHPAPGAVITWKNYNSSNSKIQNGSVVYNGELVTIKGITVNKSGNKIVLNISGCQRDESITGMEQEDSIYFSRSFGGYTAHVDLQHDEDVSIMMYDLMGRRVSARSVPLYTGTNTIEIPVIAPGIFLVTIQGNSFLHTEKLLF